MFILQGKILQCDNTFNWLTKMEPIFFHQNLNLNRLEKYISIQISPGMCIKTNVFRSHIAVALIYFYYIKCLRINFLKTIQHAVD